MKKAIASFFNKPLLVAAISLVIAGAVGSAFYLKNNASPKYRYITAASGSISSSSSAESMQHVTLGFLAVGRINSVSVKTGDAVKKGDILASLDPENTLGAITQAKAQYGIAKANYTKVLNGASTPAVDAAKAAVNTASVNADQITKEQDLKVKNAYSKLLNSTLEAYPKNPSNDDTPPTISGTYTLGKEGDIIVTTYASGADSGSSFKVSGLVEGSGTVASNNPQPLGGSGLYIQFPEDARAYQTWIISIPNAKTSDYLTNYNSYQSALASRDQAIAGAKASLDQANSNLNVVAASARPEDVAGAQAQVQSAQGAVQIAEAAYNSRLIIAPGDGSISAVYINAGEIASPNAPAIEITGAGLSKVASVVIPKYAIISRGGKNYVLLKTPSGVEEKEIVLGESDDENAEVVSGLKVGDEVAFR